MIRLEMIGKFVPQIECRSHVTLNLIEFGQCGTAIVIRLLNETQSHIQYTHKNMKEIACMLHDVVERLTHVSHNNKNFLHTITQNQKMKIHVSGIFGGMKLQHLYSIFHK